MNLPKNPIIPIFFALSLLIVLGDARENDRSSEKSLNKAVQVEITKKTFVNELAGISAPEGKIFLVLETPKT